MGQARSHDSTQAKVERAIWLDWRHAEVPDLAPDARIYLGHETCEHLLPTLGQTLRFLKRVDHDRGRALALVTPFLTDAGLSAARSLIAELLAQWGELEIVCNDWGLLWDLACERVGRLAVGRLLAGQSLDPRIDGMLTGLPAKPGPGSPGTMVRHMDGTGCLLRHRAPSADLATHFRAVSVDREGLGAFLATHGIGRCEISYPRQGLCTSGQQWAYTLHRPWIPLSVLRCQTPSPRAGVGNRQCPCSPSEEILRSPDFPVSLVQRDNVLGYCEHASLPDAALAALGIDRIVEPCALSFGRA